MTRLISLGITFLALMGMVSAFGLAFYNTPDIDECFADLDYLSCTDWAEGKCCYVSGPKFCEALCAMQELDITTTTVFTNGTECIQHANRNNLDRCIANTILCPMWLPAGTDITQGCSANWHVGEPDQDPNHPGWPLDPPSRVSAEKQCTHANVLAYDHGMGLRKIRILDGKFDEVLEAYSRKDFHALSKYEKHVG